MKTGKYLIAHHSKEYGFRYLVLRNPVEEHGYYWSDKKMKDLMSYPDENIQFMFESKQKAVQVLHDLNITQRCKIVKSNHSNKKDRTDTTHIPAITSNYPCDEKMYERIKRMTLDEMKCFVYWVYLMGNEDGWNQCCDSNDGYFSGHMLTLDREEVMPNDSIDDLWEKLDKVREYYKRK